MPGAPNRPPEPTATLPAPATAPEPADRKVLRRLTPSRIALLLDTWKGAPNPDLTGPYFRAEAAYTAGDFGEALTALDRLSVRLAEPRWPSLPEPFRALRVPIPPPMPPHWNPENALAPAEREAAHARRSAEEQIVLADASVAWASRHGIATDDLAPRLAEAKERLAAGGPATGFYEPIDAIWEALRSRAPVPKGTTPAPAAVAPADADDA